ncbi:MAG: Fe-S-containing hydro-lyase [Clostridia bacterium]|nr:Fe-S-containing hydro-lyase [Clostridia bacterium]
MEYRLNLPLKEADILKLKIGDKVLLSGTMYTARDAAHKRLIQLLDENKKLPFELEGQTIYYTGPCETKEGMAIGACGPTTSYRMDKFTPRLLDLGLKAMIGKGKRSSEVVDSMVKNRCVYFSATGGAAALYAKTVTSCKVIAFEELLSEAVREIIVKDFPVIVAIDSGGNSLYK